MTTLTIELPERVFLELRQSPREAEKDARLVLAIDWFRRGLISQGRAAELAGISRADLIDELAARKIDVIDVDLEELTRESEVG